MFDETLCEEPILNPGQVQAAYADRLEQQERERVVTLTKLPGDDERLRELVRKCERRLVQVYEAEGSE